MPPAFVGLSHMGHGDEGTPFRTTRGAHQLHSSFAWSAVALAGIALDARADDVLPGRHPVVISGDYMVEVQIAAVHMATTVLALMLVTFENIVAGELHFLARNTIKKHQQNHLGDPDLQGDGLDGAWSGFTDAPVAPTFEIVGLVIVACRLHHLGVALEEKTKRPPCGTDIHRLPEPV